MVQCALKSWESSTSAAYRRGSDSSTAGFATPEGRCAVLTQPTRTLRLPQSCATVAMVACRQVSSKQEPFRPRTVRLRESHRRVWQPGCDRTKHPTEITVGIRRDSSRVPCCGWQSVRWKRRSVYRQQGCCDLTAGLSTRSNVGRVRAGASAPPRAMRARGAARPSHVLATRARNSKAD